MNIQINDKSYTVVKTNHLMDMRENGLRRDEFISDGYLEEILRISLRNGLTSFRDKGPVRLMFKDFQDIQYGILVALEDFRIIIITIFRDTHKSYKSFIKVQNQINLFSVFTLPEESYIEYQYESTFNENYGIKSKSTAKPKLRGLRKIDKNKPKRKSTDRYDIDDSMDNYDI